MKIELSLPKSRFVVDEYFELAVRFVNDTGRALRVPDPFDMENREPTYTITGASFPGGRTTSALAATMPGHKDPPPGTPVSTIDLAPGDVVEGELPLSRWFSFRPGRHELVVAIDHDGLRAQSAPLGFDIDALRAQGIGMGAEVGVAGAGSVQCAFVQRAEGSRCIYDLLLLEDNPDLGEIIAHSMAFRRELTTAADAVLVPFSNGARTDGLSAWRLWWSDDALVADDSPLGPPATLSLSPGARLLPPAVQDDADTMDALVLEPDGQRVCVARFSGGNAPSPPTGSVVWRSDPVSSSSPIAGARLALGSRPSGSPRRVVTLQREGEQIHVSHFDVAGGGAPTATTALTIQRGQLLSGVPMTARVTTGGVTRCRFLVNTHGRKWRVYVVAVDFDEHGRVMNTGRVDLVVSLDEPMPVAAIELPFHDRDADDVTWSLLAGDGRLVWGRGSGHAQEHRLDTIPTVPLQLCPLSRATYLTVLVPGRSPTLVPLGGLDVGAKRYVG